MTEKRYSEIFQGSGTFTLTNNNETTLDVENVTICVHLDEIHCEFSFDFPSDNIYRNFKDIIRHQNTNTMYTISAKVEQKSTATDIGFKEKKGIRLVKVSNIKIDPGSGREIHGKGLISY